MLTVAMRAGLQRSQAATASYIQQCQGDTPMPDAKLIEMPRFRIAARRPDGHRQAE